MLQPILTISKISNFLISIYFYHPPWSLHSHLKTSMVLLSTLFLTRWDFQPLSALSLSSKLVLLVFSTPLFRGPKVIANTLSTKVPKFDFQLPMNLHLIFVNSLLLWLLLKALIIHYERARPFMYAKKIIFKISLRFAHLNNFRNCTRTCENLVHNLLHPFFQNVYTRFLVNLFSRFDTLKHVKSHCHLFSKNIPKVINYVPHIIRNFQLSVPRRIVFVNLKIFPIYEIPIKLMHVVLFEFYCSYG